MQLFTLYIGLFALVSVTLSQTEDCLCNPECPVIDTGCKGRLVPRADCPCCKICYGQLGDACSINKPCDASLTCSDEGICKETSSCSSNDQCSDDMICQKDSCMDPCPIVRPCLGKLKGGICVTKSHQPSCECPENHVLDEAIKSCVPLKGCFVEGKNMSVGDVSYLSNCATKCTCQPNGGLRCEETKCPHGLMPVGSSKDKRFCIELQSLVTDECCIILACDKDMPSDRQPKALTGRHVSGDDGISESKYMKTLDDLEETLLNRTVNDSYATTEQPPSAIELLNSTVLDIFGLNDDIAMAELPINMVDENMTFTVSFATSDMPLTVTELENISDTAVNNMTTIQPSDILTTDNYTLIEDQMTTEVTEQLDDEESTTDDILGEISTESSQQLDEKTSTIKNIITTPTTASPANESIFEVDNQIGSQKVSNSFTSKLESNHFEHDKPLTKSGLQVLNTDHNSTTIALPSDSGGILHYRESRTGIGSARLTIPKGQQEVVVPGLNPLTRYTYKWTGLDGKTAKMEIKTTDGCRHNVISYPLGATWHEECLTTCNCVTGGVTECRPRCIFLKGSIQDQHCKEQPSKSDPECCVVYTCEKGENDLAGDVEFKSLSSKTTEDVEAKLIVTSRQHNSVTVAWDDFKAVSPQESYVAEYRKVLPADLKTDDPWMKKETVKGNPPPTLTIDNLEPNQLYEVRVSIYGSNKERESTASTETITVRTEAGCIYGNSSVPVGEFFQGCDERCTCLSDGSAKCSERCTIPYFRKGSFDKDPLCTEELIDGDECCVLVMCAHGELGGTEEDYDQCANTVCGANAKCISLSSYTIVAVGSDTPQPGTCQCKDGYTGDPSDLAVGCVSDGSKVAAGMTCTFKENTYVSGEQFLDGCQYKCKCDEGGEIGCEPRCQFPKADPVPDDNCEYLPDPNDDCCRVRSCNTTEEGSVIGPASLAFDGCMHANQSYAKDEQFTMGCELKCQCHGYGDVSCFPRCPPIKEANDNQDKACQTLKDPSDPCCNYTICADPTPDVMKNFPYFPVDEEIAEEDIEMDGAESEGNKTMVENKIMNTDINGTSGNNSITTNLGNDTSTPNTLSPLLVNGTYPAVISNNTASNFINTTIPEVNNTVPTTSNATEPRNIVSGTTTISTTNTTGNPLTGNVTNIANKLNRMSINSTSNAVGFKLSNGGGTTIFNNTTNLPGLKTSSSMNLTTTHANKTLPYIATIGISGTTKKVTHNKTTNNLVRQSRDKSTISATTNRVNVTSPFTSSNQTNTKLVNNNTIFNAASFTTSSVSQHRKGTVLLSIATATENTSIMSGMLNYTQTIPLRNISNTVSSRNASFTPTSNSSVTFLSGRSFDVAFNDASTRRQNVTTYYKENSSQTINGTDNITTEYRTYNLGNNDTETPSNQYRKTMRFRRMVTHAKTASSVPTLKATSRIIARTLSNKQTRLSTISSNTNSVASKYISTIAKSTSKNTKQLKKTGNSAKKKKNINKARLNVKTTATSIIPVTTKNGNSSSASNGATFISTIRSSVKNSVIVTGRSKGNNSVTTIFPANTSATSILSDVMGNNVSATITSSNGSVASTIMVRNGIKSKENITKGKTGFSVTFPKGNVTPTAPVTKTRIPKTISTTSPVTKTRIPKTISTTSQRKLSLSTNLQRKLSLSTNLQRKLSLSTNLTNITIIGSSVPTTQGLVYVTNVTGTSNVAYSGMSTVSSRIQKRRLSGGTSVSPAPVSSMKPTKDGNRNITSKVTAATLITNNFSRIGSIKNKVNTLKSSVKTIYSGKTVSGNSSTMSTINNGTPIKIYITQKSTLGPTNLRKQNGSETTTTSNFTFSSTTPIRSSTIATKLPITASANKNFKNNISLKTIQTTGKTSMRLSSLNTATNKYLPTSPVVDRSNFTAVTSNTTDIRAITTSKVIKKRASSTNSTVFSTSFTMSSSKTTPTKTIFTNIKSRISSMKNTLNLGKMFLNSTLSPQNASGSSFITTPFVIKATKFAKADNTSANLTTFASTFFRTKKNNLNSKFAVTGLLSTVMLNHTYQVTNGSIKAPPNTGKTPQSTIVSFQNATGSSSLITPTVSKSNVARSTNSDNTSTSTTRFSSVSGSKKNLKTNDQTIKTTKISTRIENNTYATPNASGNTVRNIRYYNASTSFLIQNVTENSSLKTLPASKNFSTKSKISASANALPTTIISIPIKKKMKGNLNSKTIVTTQRSTITLSNASLTTNSLAGTTLNRTRLPMSTMSPASSVVLNFSSTASTITGIGSTKSIYGSKANTTLMTLASNRNKKKTRQKLSSKAPVSSLLSSTGKGNRIGITRKATETTRSERNKAISTILSVQNFTGYPSTTLTNSSNPTNIDNTTLNTATLSSIQQKKKVTTNDKTIEATKLSASIANNTYATPKTSRSSTNNTGNYNASTISSVQNSTVISSSTIQPVTKSFFAKSANFNKANTVLTTIISTPTKKNSKGNVKSKNNVSTLLSTTNVINASAITNGLIATTINRTNLPVSTMSAVQNISSNAPLKTALSVSNTKSKGNTPHVTLSSSSSKKNRQKSSINPIVSLLFSSTIEANTSKTTVGSNKTTLRTGKPHSSTIVLVKNFTSNSFPKSPVSSTKMFTTYMNNISRSTSIPKSMMKRKEIGTSINASNITFSKFSTVANKNSQTNLIPQSSTNKILFTATPPKKTSLNTEINITSISAEIYKSANISALSNVTGNSFSTSLASRKGLSTKSTYTDKSSTLQTASAFRTLNTKGSLNIKTLLTTLLPPTIATSTYVAINSSTSTTPNGRKNPSSSLKTITAYSIFPTLATKKSISTKINSVSTNTNTLKSTPSQNAIKNKNTTRKISPKSKITIIPSTPTIIIKKTPRTKLTYATLPKNYLKKNGTAKFTFTTGKNSLSTISSIQSAAGNSSVTTIAVNTGFSAQNKNVLNKGKMPMTTYKKKETNTKKSITSELSSTTVAKQKLTKDSSKTMLSTVNTPLRAISTISKVPNTYFSTTPALIKNITSHMSSTINKTNIVMNKPALTSLLNRNGKGGTLTTSKTLMFLLNSTITTNRNGTAKLFATALTNKTLSTQQDSMSTTLSTGIITKNIVLLSRKKPDNSSLTTRAGSKQFSTTTPNTDKTRLRIFASSLGKGKKGGLTKKVILTNITSATVDGNSPSTMKMFMNTTPTQSRSSVSTILSTYNATDNASLTTTTIVSNITSPKLAIFSNTTDARISAFTSTDFKNAKGRRGKSSDGKTTPFSPKSSVATSIVYSPKMTTNILPKNNFLRQNSSLKTTLNIKQSPGSNISFVQTLNGTFSMTPSVSVPTYTMVTINSNKTVPANPVKRIFTTGTNKNSASMSNSTMTSLNKGKTLTNIITKYSDSSTTTSKNVATSNKINTQMSTLGPTLLKNRNSRSSKILKEIRTTNLTTVSMKTYPSNVTLITSSTNKISVTNGSMTTKFNAKKIPVFRTHANTYANATLATQPLGNSNISHTSSTSNATSSIKKISVPTSLINFTRNLGPSTTTRNSNSSSQYRVKSNRTLSDIVTVTMSNKSSSINGTLSTISSNRTVTPNFSITPSVNKGSSTQYTNISIKTKTPISTLAFRVIKKKKGNLNSHTIPGTKVDESKQPQRTSSSLHITVSTFPPTSSSYPNSVPNDTMNSISQETSTNKSPNTNEAVKSQSTVVSTNAFSTQSTRKKNTLNAKLLTTKSTSTSSTDIRSSIAKIINSKFSIPTGASTHAKVGTNQSNTLISLAPTSQFHTFTGYGKPTLTNRSVMKLDTKNTTQKKITKLGDKGISIIVSSNTLIATSTKKMPLTNMSVAVDTTGTIFLSENRTRPLLAKLSANPTLGAITTNLSHRVHKKLAIKPPNLATNMTDTGNKRVGINLFTSTTPNSIRTFLTPIKNGGNATISSIPDISTSTVHGKISTFNPPTRGMSAKYNATELKISTGRTNSISYVSIGSTNSNKKPAVGASKNIGLQNSAKNKTIVPFTSATKVKGSIDRNIGTKFVSTVNNITNATVTSKIANTGNRKYSTNTLQSSGKLMKAILKNSKISQGNAKNDGTHMAEALGNKIITYASNISVTPAESSTSSTVKEKLKFTTRLGTTTLMPSTNISALFTAASLKNISTTTFSANNTKTFMPKDNSSLTFNLKENVAMSITNPNNTVYYTVPPSKVPVVSNYTKISTRYISNSSVTTIIFKMQPSIANEITTSANFTNAIGGRKLSLKMFNTKNNSDMLPNSFSTINNGASSTRTARATIPKAMNFTNNSSNKTAVYSTITFSTRSEATSNINRNIFNDHSVTNNIIKRNTANYSMFDGNNSTVRIQSVSIKLTTAFDSLIRSVFNSNGTHETNYSLTSTITTGNHDSSVFSGSTLMTYYLQPNVSNGTLPTPTMKHGPTSNTSNLLNVTQKPTTLKSSSSNFTYTKATRSGSNGTGTEPMATVSRNLNVSSKTVHDSNSTFYNNAATRGIPTTNGSYSGKTSYLLSSLTLKSMSTESTTKQANNITLLKTVPKNVTLHKSTNYDYVIVPTSSNITRTFSVLTQNDSRTITPHITNQISTRMNVKQLTNKTTIAEIDNARNVFSAKNQTSNVTNAVRAQTTDKKLLKDFMTAKTVNSNTSNSSMGVRNTTFLYNGSESTSKVFIPSTNGMHHVSGKGLNSNATTPHLSITLSNIGESTTKTYATSTIGAITNPTISKVRVLTVKRTSQFASINHSLLPKSDTIGKNIRIRTSEATPKIHFPTTKSMVVIEKIFPKLFKHKYHQLLPNQIQKTSIRKKHTTTEPEPLYLPQASIYRLYNAVAGGASSDNSKPNSLTLIFAQPQSKLMNNLSLSDGLINTKKLFLNATESKENSNSSDLPWIFPARKFFLENGTLVSVNFNADRIIADKEFLLSHTSLKPNETLVTLLANYTDSNATTNRNYSSDRVLSRIVNATGLFALMNDIESSINKTNENQIRRFSDISSLNTTNIPISSDLVNRNYTKPTIHFVNNKRSSPKFGKENTEKMVNGTDTYTTKIITNGIVLNNTTLKSSSFNVTLTRMLNGIVTQRTIKKTGSTLHTMSSTKPRMHMSLTTTVNVTKKELLTSMPTTTNVTTSAPTTTPISIQETTIVNEKGILERRLRLEDHVPTANYIEILVVNPVDSETVKLTVKVSQDIMAQLLSFPKQSLTVSYSDDSIIWTNQSIPFATIVIKSVDTIELTVNELSGHNANMFTVSYDGIKSSIKKSPLFVEPTKPRIMDTTPAQQTQCSFKGKIYKAKEEFYDGCEQFCMCTEEFKIHCAPINCPARFGLDIMDPDCLDWEDDDTFVGTPPNCCGARPKCVLRVSDLACTVQGHTFQHLDVLSEEFVRCDQRCQCMSGNLECENLCPSVQATPPFHLPCPPTQAILVKSKGHPCCNKWECSNGTISGPPSILPPDIHGIIPTQAPRGIALPFIQEVSSKSVKLTFFIPKSFVGLPGGIYLRYTSNSREHPNPLDWQSEVIHEEGMTLTDHEWHYEKTNLQPATNYSMQVVLNSHLVKSEMNSPAFTVSTLMEATTPLPRLELDARLSVSDIQNVSARISWRQFTEFELRYIDGIRVRYWPANKKFPLEGPMLHRAADTMILRELEPDTKYNVDLFFIPHENLPTTITNTKTISFTTLPKPKDKYAFNITIQMGDITNEGIQILYSGVLEPEGKYVNVFRVVYTSDGASRDSHKFKVPKNQKEGFIVLSDLKPGVEYEVWLEAYLTNGSKKKSNVITIKTQPGDLPRPAKTAIDPSTSEDSSESYYSAMVGVSILSALVFLAFLIVLYLFCRRQNQASARISKSAYDNPSYKGSEGGYAMEMNGMKSNNGNQREEI